MKIYTVFKAITLVERGKVPFSKYLCILLPNSFLGIRFDFSINISDWSPLSVTPVKGGKISIKSSSSFIDKIGVALWELHATSSLKLFPSFLFNQ